MKFIVSLAAIAMVLAFTIQPAQAGRPAQCHRAKVQLNWCEICAVEFAALGAGAIVWEARRMKDTWCQDQFKKKVDLDRKLPNGADHPCKNNLTYCLRYSKTYLHYQWNSECYAYDNHLRK